MPRRLTVQIAPDGSVQAEASGTPGPSCVDAIEQLRALLHAEPVDSKPTPEFSLLPLGSETVRSQSQVVEENP